MKAQLTLEYLMLFLVFMLVLSLVLGIIYSLKLSSEKTLEILNFKKQINGVSGKINEVCSLGSGNKRAFSFDYSFEINYFSDGIEFVYKNSSIAKSFPCKIKGDSFFEETMLIENLDGEIILENQKSLKWYLKP